MNAIRTNKLEKHYGKARGIVELDLSVEEGEFFGFIGPNGAGKSTTIRILLGLIRPSAGSAEIFGRDVTEEKVPLLREIGYLPAESAFYPGMRVRDILDLSAGLRKKDCAKESARLCDRLQLDVSRRVDELSFGNRKKVAIVCALQHCPRLLILDEPTGGLDPLMQREFFEILKERNRAGATVFFSSHILSEVQRNCTHAAMIRAGRIIACNSVAALSKSNAKRICIHGSADLHGLAGVRDRQEAAGTVRFLYSGEMQPLLQALSAGSVQDLTISEPELEEIFLHYYEKDGDRTWSS